VYLDVRFSSSFHLHQAFPSAPFFSQMSTHPPVLFWALRLLCVRFPTSLRAFPRIFFPFRSFFSTSCVSTPLQLYPLLDVQQSRPLSFRLTVCLAAIVSSFFFRMYCFPSVFSFNRRPGSYPFSGLRRSRPIALAEVFPLSFYVSSGCLAWPPPCLSPDLHIGLLVRVNFGPSYIPACPNVFLEVSFAQLTLSGPIFFSALLLNGPRPLFFPFATKKGLPKVACRTTLRRPSFFLASLPFAGWACPAHCFFFFFFSVMIKYLYVSSGTSLS